MSRHRSSLLSLALLLGLAAIAGAAPMQRAVPVLPPLNAPATDPPAPAAAPLAAATVVAGETALYQGQAPDQAGLTLAPWGGGAVENDATLFLENGHSLKITTVDDYQGAKITFNTPVSLGDLTATRFLQMSFHFPKVAAPAPAAGAAQGDGDTPNVPAPAPQADTPVITSLRWVLTLADGRQAEVRRTLPENVVYGHDWFQLAVPLSALKFPAGPASPLQSVIVTGNGYAQFSLGEIKIISDDTPLTASAGRSQSVPKTAQVVFHGTGDGGASALRYTWNFGTTTDGAAQAEGQTVQTQYDTAGTYTVTLTVSDVDGVKKPATSTLTLTVQ